MPVYPCRRRCAPAAPYRLVLAAAWAEALEGRVLLSAASVSNEFPANQTTVGNQSAAAIAADGDGDFVVAWESGQDGSGNGVYARRYNAAGIAQGGEFRVNTFTTGNQFGPAVAADADGDFLIAWTSDGQDGSSFGVYAQRYDAAGSPVGAEFRVNTFTSSFQRSPAVAMDAAGDAVVAWQSYGQDGGGYGVYAQRYDSFGRPQGAEFRVNATTAGSQSDPSAAADAAGNVVVTWTSENQDTSGVGVYAQRYSPTGVAQGGETRVNTFTAGNQSRSSVAAGRGGNFVVAWQSDGQDGGGLGVYAQRYDAAGTAQGTEFRANVVTAGNQGRPAVAADAAGDFVVSWESVGQDRPNSYGIFARQYTAAGVAATTEFIVNSFMVNEQRAPAAAMDAAGDFVVAWQSYTQDGSGYGVYAQRYDETTDAAPPVVASVTAAGNRLLPGATVRAPVPSVTVSFDENLTTTGGAAGPNSVTNPANWGLTFNGQDASARITAVAFASNPATNKYEATLTFSPPLAFDGDYVLRARQAIRDAAGNALDGNFDGTPGGDFVVPFVVHPTVPVGPEFRANTYTSSTQRGAAVATDAAGDFVVAWESYYQDGGKFGVYAQRYNAAGVPLGGEFHVSTATADNQQRPSVAMDAAGDFVVAWESYLQDGSSSGVYAQRFNAAGVAQGGEFRANTTTASIQEAASVAMDAAGNFVIAWCSFGQDGDLSGIYAQRYNAAGAPLGGEFRVNTTTADFQRRPAVAMDAAGDFVVAWQSYGQDGGAYGIYAQRYNAAGVAQGTEFRANTFTANRQERASVAVDAVGDFVITWMSNGQDGSTPASYSIYAQRYDAAGTPRGAEFRANTTTADAQVDPRVALDADGDFVIAWGSNGQDGSGSGVYAQRYDARGTPQGGEFRANTVVAGNQSRPSVAADAAGDFVIAWASSGQDGSGDGVYAQRYGVNERPTTLGIGSFTVTENVIATTIGLRPLFADTTDASSALVYSTSVVNAALFSSTPVDGSGNLKLNYAPNAAGAAVLTVRATDSGGLFVESTFAVVVRPTWLTVPADGAWSISGTPTNYTLALTAGNFVIPSDPAALNPNLNVGVAAPATLTVNADVHIAGLTLTGLGAAVTFNGPAGGGLSFTGGSIPLAVPVPDDENPGPPAPLPPPPPALSVGDVGKAEGNTGLTVFAFPVTLDRAGDKPVRVYYATANVTAAHGSDYLVAGGVLTFKPGETRKVVTVQVEGDALFEADERFRVVLYGATGAVVADDTGVGTIKNDDAPPAPRVSAAAAIAAEGDGGMKGVAFDVSLDRPAATAVTIRYATADGTAKAGSDYVAVAGTVTFKPGETRKRVTLYIKGDKSQEDDETFFLDLSGPAGAARGRGVIRNDD